MKRIIILLNLIIMSHQLSHAQQAEYEKDVQTIDAIMKASYEVVSGEQGAERQWERDRYLHHPKAVYSYFDKQSAKQLTIPLKDFHQQTDDMVFHTAFYESEVNQEVRIFGNIAHVWSTYQTQLKKDGPIERRGINSIQLIHENNRWYIISWTFCGESDSNKIPATFDRH